MPSVHFPPLVGLAVEATVRPIVEPIGLQKSFQLFIENVQMREILYKYKVIKYTAKLHLIYTNKGTKYFYQELKENGTLKAEYTYNGGSKTTTLKLSKWLLNRGLDEITMQKCLKELIKPMELKFRYVHLVDGYNKTAINSCMSGNGDYYETLEDNGNMLIAHDDDNNELGRAIIWRNVSGLPERAEGFMDRIYPSDNHKVVASYIEYAKKHNLIYKAAQNHISISDFMWEGEKCNFDISIESELEEGQVPYMDTFRYYDDKIISNHNRSGYTCTDTNGSFEEHARICYGCGDPISEDDEVYIESTASYVCNDCYENNYFYCEFCGNYFHNDDAVDIYDGPTVCQECARAQFYYSNYYDSYLDREDCVYSQQDNEYYHDNDDVNYSEYSSDYSKNEELEIVHMHDGSKQWWFECEADDYAHYCDEDNRYYEDSEDMPIEDEEEVV